MNDITWLQESHQWPGLQCVFAVERTVICRGRKSQETSFYIANKDAPAEKLLAFVREHWKIESMHWIWGMRKTASFHNAKRELKRTILRLYQNF